MAGQRCFLLESATAAEGREDCPDTKAREGQGQSHESPHELSRVSTHRVLLLNDSTIETQY